MNNHPDIRLLFFIEYKGRFVWMLVTTCIRSWIPLTFCI